MRALLVLLLCLCLSACSNEATTVDDYNARIVTLPDGTTVKAEVMMHPTDMARGMMFRDSFPEGRGMLFIHSTPAQYSYYMFQVKIPLDIVWMDQNRRVVEMHENVPPCTAKATECPTYGGNKTASYVLELPAGYARKHGIREDAVLQF